jgi:hypothetical protein
MARKKKVIEGALYTNDKNQVVHAFDVWGHNVEYVGLPGSECETMTAEEFQERFPEKIDRIEVVRE